jgi:ligand-binding sensor protein
MQERWQSSRYVRSLADRHLSVLAGPNSSDARLTGQVPIDIHGCNDAYCGACRISQLCRYVQLCRLIAAAPRLGCLNCRRCNRCKHLAGSFS